eukprot:CAMPEP_0202371288 /NCGR_PEP_ID=MMETSP1127-20130417/2730_1 /ASSEMBLY_ACC=CAM_ASM_000462 /TAXON_ID=3047 /ORGANISM="Dunaliella tertiolecta, Strain CCMP1320" /LENGTH=41 /DNA_ID= /DNA_START= /DNA_END= /DNA_ORIENTATION=
MTGMYGRLRHAGAGCGWEGGRSRGSVRVAGMYGRLGHAGAG